MILRYFINAINKNKNDIKHLNTHLGPCSYYLRKYRCFVHKNCSCPSGRNACFSTYVHEFDLQLDEHQLGSIFI